MPIIFICILILVLWIRYETNKLNHQSKSLSESFWARENEANRTRNQNIDDLDYITLPMDKFPLFPTKDSHLESLQSSLSTLATEKIVDLSQYSNTDLKLKYGVGNFSLLAQYDNNYSLLLQVLTKLARYHLENNQLDYARIYYEYAIECHSQNPQIYVDLAELYCSQGNNLKFEELLEKIRSSTMITRDTLLDKCEILANPAFFHDSK